MREEATCIAPILNMESVRGTSDCTSSKHVLISTEKESSQIIKTDRGKVRKTAEVLEGTHEANAIMQSMVQHESKKSGSRGSLESQDHLLDWYLM